MFTLVSTPDLLAKAKESLKTCAYSYRGPETTLTGEDIMDALDRVIRVLSDVPPAKVSKVAFVKVNKEDVYTSAAALKGDHWLRSFWQREGFRLAPPAPQKFAFGR